MRILEFIIPPVGIFLGIAIYHFLLSESKMTQSFDIDEYNSRECQVHNHGFYLGEQSK